MTLPRIRLRGDRAPRSFWPAARARRPASRWRKVVNIVLIVFIAVPLALIVLYRVVPPPVTPLMLIRLAQGEGIAKDWVQLSQISPEAAYAAIASEDNRFCIHYGFDFEAIQDVMEGYGEGGELRGASTISMQTAKNLFLWPGRSWIRKGFEAYLTAFLELLWPKRRIIEVYLNIAEWGHGIYGIEAASRKYFGKPAARLTRHEAALLVAVLPNPREWSANPPGRYVAGRADVIAGRIPKLGPLLDCVRESK